MSVKLGFVGVGKHAQRMAAAFRACGAEIVAYDRDGVHAIGERLASGFGKRMLWGQMLRSDRVDAIVCCAPPDVTLAVANECLKSATRCCATKPLGWTDFDALLLQDNEDMLQRGIYVDIWRLYSPSWRALKAEIGSRPITSCDIVFVGDGPVRSTHSGLLDYGPHALAFALDLGLPLDPLTWLQQSDGWYAESLGLNIVTGNTARQPQMSVRVEFDGGELAWSESGSGQALERYPGAAILMEHDRDLALRAFCRAFLAGEPSDTLRISCEAMRVLQAAELGAKV